MKKIAMVIASSDIAITLLNDGLTVYSVLKLPLHIHNKPNTMCNTKKKIATISQKSSDECTINHRYSLEALRRTIRNSKTMTDNCSVGLFYYYLMIMVHIWSSTTLLETYLKQRFWLESLKEKSFCYHVYFYNTTRINNTFQKVSISHTIGVPHDK